MTHHDQASVVNQAYWDKAYAALPLAAYDQRDELVLFLEAHIPERYGHALEVGVFPGRFQPLLGRLGYTLHGLDTTSRVRELGPWLASQGFQVGEFFHCDFLEFTSPRKYDLVFSAGFVEHFTNWDTVMRRHCALLAPGGTLVVTFPNFAGIVQHALHAWLDDENLARHHIPAMNLDAYARICAEDGLRISFAGYVGGFDFWVDTQPKSWIQRKLVALMVRVARHARRLPPCRALAPYAALVAHKAHQ